MTKEEEIKWKSLFDGLSTSVYGLCKKISEFKNENDVEIGIDGVTEMFKYQISGFIKNKREFDVSH